MCQNFLANNLNNRRDCFVCHNWRCKKIFPLSYPLSNCSNFNFNLPISVTLTFPIFLHFIFLFSFSQTPFWALAFTSANVSHYYIFKIANCTFPICSSLNISRLFLRLFANITCYKYAKVKAHPSPLHINPQGTLEIDKTFD